MPKRPHNVFLGAASADHPDTAELLLQGDSGPLELQAAGDGDDSKKIRRFKIVAYNGGQMQLAALYWPVVLDLAGLDVSTQKRPIFYQHDPTRIVGHSESIAIRGKKIHVAGVVSGVGDDAKEVVETSDNGFPWQASIGAPANQIEFVERGSSVKVNGRTFQGPLYVARQAQLREVSFVALGADDKTSAVLSARSNQESEMKFNEWLKANGWDPEVITDAQRVVLQAAFDAQATPPPAPPAAPPATPPPVPARLPDPPPATPLNAAAPPDQLALDRQARADEVERCGAIRTLCAASPTIQVGDAEVNLEAHAIREGWTRDRVELEILRASRPAPGPAIHMASTDGASATVIEAAMARTMGVKDCDKAYDPKTLEAADKHFRRGIGLQELLLTAAVAAGYVGRAFRITDSNLRAVLKAAFTSADVSGIMSNVANKLLLDSFLYTEQTWRQISAIGSVNDFKTHTRYRLIGDAQFEALGPTGELKAGTLGEDSMTNQASTYGKIFGLSRQDIINDDLSALDQVTKRIGRGAGLKLNDVFWTAFMDNAAFFAAGNSNYISGATTALDSAALQQGETAIMNQTDNEGKPLGAQAAILLVPNALSVTARELYVSTNINTGGSATKAKVPDTNIWAGRFTPAVSSYLGNSAYTGYSVVAWYLLCDPRDIPVIETVFLNGQQEPTVETAEADFDQLGIQMRGYFDFGVAKQEYRGGLKSKGAA